MINLEKIKNVGSFRKYKIDEYICKEGDKGDEMYIVLSGRADVYINLMDGTPLKISEIPTGGFFGEMSILENASRNATVIAGDNMIVVGIDRNGLINLIKEEPHFAYNIMKGLSSRVRRMNSELKEISSQFRCSLLEEDGHPNQEMDRIIITDNALFHKNHKHYEGQEPDSYKGFYYETDIKCPICEKEFTAKQQRLSKLCLDRIENDFRRIYKDFEPLWYNIWICPNCYYAKYYTDFENVSDACYKKIKSDEKNFKEKIIINTDGKLDINFVFATYYVALYWANVCNDNPLKVANLWMSLSWLYKDIGDEEMYEVAYEEAFINFYEAYYNSKTVELTAAQEQQMCILLGELFYRKGEKDKALKHLRHAVRNKKTGVETLNKKARDRIYEIKNLGE
ncbi:MAG: DUF2225 domain-containing protein [Firmicutes bacterium]|nr:DUF2225 domain-containing protein [Bacillota bacterium]